MNKYSAFEIFRRLGAYLRSYIYYVLLFLVVLLLSAAAEVAMPLFVRQAVDHNLLVRYIRFPSGVLTEEDIVRDEEDLPHIQGFVYVRDIALKGLSQKRRRKLREDNRMSKGYYYVFPSTQVPTYPIAGLKKEGRYAVLPLAVIKEISYTDRKQIRTYDVEGLKKNSFYFLMVNIALFIFSLVQVYVLALLGQGIMKDLRITVFKHMLAQSMKFFSLQPVGKIVTHVTNDVETVNELFVRVLPSLLKNLAIMGTVIVVIFFLSYRLGFVTVITLVPILVITVLSRMKVRNAFRWVRESVAKINIMLSEYLSGISIVQLFSQEKKTRGIFQKDNNRLMEANIAQVYVYAIFRPMIDLFYAISVAIILYSGALFLLRYKISLGVLIAYISLVDTFYQQVMSISEGIVSLQNAMAGGEKVFSFLDHNEKVTDVGKNNLPIPIKGSIVFENVSFSYGREMVLREFSVHIKAGQTIAIVGYTGAGKSTIVNLLTRLWDAHSGRILLDGMDIKSVPLWQLRGNVQLLPQDVFLFQDTVEENICLGKRSIAQSAAKKLGIHPFILSLPRGYHSILGEDANNISTGQRQLITFARIIAHDPRVIILDEATASIDTETEQIIQSALSVLCSGRTAIIIAHRLSTIKHADNILVLHKGQLIEQGTYTVLMRQKKLFYMLARMQNYI